MFPRWCRRAGTRSTPPRDSVSRAKAKGIGTLRAVAVRQSDPVAGLYRTLLIFAAVGIIILAAGLAEFAYFEPLTPSGLHVHIVGVFHYDPATQQTSGPDEQSFRRADQ